MNVYGKRKSRHLRKKIYGKINLLCSFVCLGNVVLCKRLFTNEEINSSTTATSENNGKESEQTDAASATSATKDFRSSKTAVTAATTSKQENGLFKINCASHKVYVATKKGKKETASQDSVSLPASRFASWWHKLNDALDRAVLPLIDKIKPRSFHRNRMSGLHSD
jgi:hypothetical protein